MLWIYSKNESVSGSQVERLNGVNAGGRNCSGWKPPGQDVRPDRNTCRWSTTGIRPATTGAGQGAGVGALTGLPAAFQFGDGRTGPAEYLVAAGCTYITGRRAQGPHGSACGPERLEQAAAFIAHAMPDRADTRLHQAFGGYIK